MPHEKNSSGRSFRVRDVATTRQSRSEWALSKLKLVVGLVHALGLTSAVRVLGRRAMRLSAPVRMRPRVPGICDGTQTMELRPGDSDLYVAAQVFGWLEYELDRPIVEGLNRLAREWRAAGLVPVIVDAGANVGYSSAYFAAAFPDALVIAVEPDPVSFACLRRNVGHNERVKAVQAALWSDDAGLTLRHGVNGSWSSIFVEGGVADTATLTLDELLRQVPGARPLVIKLDIEGAERRVCETSPGQFHDAPCIIIEPHDFMERGAACLAPLFAAIAGRAMDTLVRGENIVLIDSRHCAVPV